MISAAWHSRLDPEGTRPPVPSHTNDERHWRERAAHIRAMKDQEAITLMTDLANDYDKMADRAAQRAKQDK